MSNNANINSIPVKLINECCFCHKKGLKPGLLAQEFKQDTHAQEHFSKIPEELALNNNGMCNECEIKMNKKPNKCIKTIRSSLIGTFKRGALAYLSKASYAKR